MAWLGSAGLVDFLVEVTRWWVFKYIRVVLMFGWIVGGLKLGFFTSFAVLWLMLQQLLYLFVLSSSNCCCWLSKRIWHTGALRRK